MTKLKTILIAGILLAAPFVVSAQTTGQEVVFHIDASYDLKGRKELTAILVKVTDQLYFYVDQGWWQEMDSVKKQSLNVSFNNLATEFERKIYPTLTTTFGSEPRPGIDQDERITILIHPMIEKAGGYFNSGDVYFKLQYPRSNEREMVYLNARHITSEKAKSFLAHEFTHLITVNQKDLLRKVTEETWLNEARAEYAPTLLGYDEVYKGSNLETRVKAFLENPNVSLTEWLNSPVDYGAISLFGHYLVDHYGIEVLVDSLKSSKVGIPSLEEALAKKGVQKTFSEIFADWAIALFVNDCSLGQRYCYLNENLKNLRIVPTLYFLPKTETTLSTIHGTTYWALNWHKFVGGGNFFTLNFEGDPSVEFKVPYILCDKTNRCSVKSLILDAAQKGKLSLEDFNQRYNSLTIIPFITSKKEGFDGEGRNFTFSWEVSVNQRSPQSEEELRNQLLAQIAELQKQVRQLQSQLASLLAKRQEGRIPLISCQKFNNNLYFGMLNNPEVRCLQEFLKAQGPEIYPEGLVTGNFLSLTRAAVIRFQEKYASEILAPLGLEKGTGYVGPMTRAKINQLLQK